MLKIIYFISSHCLLLAGNGCCSETSSGPLVTVCGAQPRAACPLHGCRSCAGAGAVLVLELCWCWSCAVAGTAPWGDCGLAAMPGWHRAGGSAGSCCPTGSWRLPAATELLGGKMLLAFTKVCFF